MLQGLFEGVMDESDTLSVEDRKELGRCRIDIEGDSAWLLDFTAGNLQVEEIAAAFRKVHGERSYNWCVKLTRDTLLDLRDDFRGYENSVREGRVQIMSRNAWCPRASSVPLGGPVPESLSPVRRIFASLKNRGPIVRLPRRDAQSEIPKIIHFIHIGKRQFGLLHFVAVRSAHTVNCGYEIVLHCDSEPHGFWWDKAKPHIRVAPIIPPTHIGGIPLEHAAHQADVHRLMALGTQGGIYLDLDIVCVRPFTALLKHTMVLGAWNNCWNFWDGRRLWVANSVVMARAGAPFINRWLEGYDPRSSAWLGFRSRGQDTYWDEMSGRYPALLAASYPDAVHLEYYRSFYWPLWWFSHRQWLFHSSSMEAPVDTEEECPPGGGAPLEGAAPFGGYVMPGAEHAFCHHMWESDDDLRPEMTLESILRTDTHFSRLCRPYLEDLREIPPRPRVTVRERP